MTQSPARPVQKGLTADSECEQMLAYNVLDKHNTDIGHVSGVWTAPQGQIAFVGVKTTWLVGKTHVIPAQGMEVNHQHETIRVPYSAEVVKNAPTYDPGEELDHTSEVHAYYGQHGMPRSAQAQRAGQASISVRMPRKPSQTEGQISEQVRKEDVEIEETGEASRLNNPAGAPANRLREQQDKPRSQRQKS